MSSAATTFGLGIHVNPPLSPLPFLYVSIATRMLYGWILDRLMSAVSVMRSQMCCVREEPPGVMMPISVVLSLPKLRIKAVSGIPLPFPFVPLFVRSASQTLRCLKSCDGSCSRQRPTWLISWTIRSSSWAEDWAAVAGFSGLSAIVCISLMAHRNVFVGSAVGGAVARIWANSSFVLNTCSIARRPPSSFIFFGSMWISVRTSLMVQPSRFWYFVVRFAISIPVRE